MDPMALGALLGLRPLDRVQLNDQATNREMSYSVQQGFGQLELPFLYYQRTLGGGMLELRAPGGSTCRVRPSDICDVAPGQPMAVRMMTREAFVARNRLRPVPPPGDADYAEAHVLYATKNKWGLDQVAGWFLDPALNADRPTLMPLHREDWARVREVARRNVMPVLGPRGASYSADHGQDRIADLARATVRHFVASVLAGDAAAAALLAQAGIEQPGHAQPNRLARRRHATCAMVEPRDDGCTN